MRVATVRFTITNDAALYAFHGVTLRREIVKLTKPARYCAGEHVLKVKIRDRLAVIVMTANGQTIQEVRVEHVDAEAS